MIGQPPHITRDLVARAQGGDEASLKALVERAYPRVRRWALVRLRDPTEADDLTQDVMLRMLRQIDSFDGASRFDTWLYAVTRNAATDRLRAHGRRRRAEVDPRVYEQLAPDQAGDPSRRAEQVQTRELLRVLFEELPARQREVVDLVELQGLSTVEAARMMHVDPTTARVHLFRARRQLRERILNGRPDLVEPRT